MDSKRQGEIALLAIKKQMRKQGLNLGPDLKRKIGSEAKEIGITPEEAMEFAYCITVQLVEETFGKRV